MLLAAPVRVRAGEEFTVTLDEGEDRCFVSRVPVGGRTERRECSARLDEVLRALVDLGAQYTDVIDLLRQLERRQGVNCEIKHLTPPQALPLDELLAQMREPAAAP